MKPQIYVGTYRLCSSNVDLYALTHENNGYFYGAPDDNSLPRIKVGISSIHWDQVVNILLHESFEMALDNIRVRYEKSGSCGDMASYLFCFDHCQFVEACESVSRFITPALPELASVYKKAHRKRK